MLNHIVIMGRLTRDPELRHTQSGIAVASFTLAVERDYKAEGGEREADFIDIVAWRSSAEFVQKYFFKGQMAVVSGRLQVRSWTDNSGNKRRSAEVVADNVYFGEAKKEGRSSGTGYQGGYSDSDVPPAYGGYAPQSTNGNPPQPAAGSLQTQIGEYAEITEEDDDLPF